MNLHDENVCAAASKELGRMIGAGSGERQIQPKLSRRNVGNIQIWRRDCPFAEMTPRRRRDHRTPYDDGMVASTIGPKLSRREVMRGVACLSMCYGVSTGSGAATAANVNAGTGAGTGNGTGTGTGTATTSQRFDFRQGLRVDDWSWHGNGRWQVTASTLSLVKAGTVQGPIRKPAALAILREPVFERISASARFRSTAPTALAERDLLFVFGFQSPTRFYYAHLSAKADTVHSGIFVVADADRRRLDPISMHGVMSGTGWQTFRLDWDANSGAIAVFGVNAPHRADAAGAVDSSKPLLAAQDKSLGAGAFGFGSFDDTGEFSEIVIDGQRKR